MNIFEIAVVVILAFKDKARSDNEDTLYNAACDVIGSSFNCWEEVDEPENYQK